MILNRTLYTAFVVLLAFSPILSLVLSDLAGFELSWWSFMRVGAGLSLPVSLLGARVFGERAYCDYWAYLESFPGNSKTVILMSWASMTAVVLVFGILGLAT